MATLAINGGLTVRKTDLPNYNPLGEEEAQAAYDVVKKGVLSDYLGCWSDNFEGGENVKQLEKKWVELFQVKHAISVNSNTTGLFTALGALGIGLGDEVIVSPYSMSISACAPLFYGAIPVFADIDPDYYCLDPVDVEKKITDKTKAIIAVDIFGHPYNYKAINKLAEKYNLRVIEDSAQAPFGKIDNKFAGSLGDLGVFSLNYHKHIHTGEGGIIVTNDDDLADRCKLIRNHAEAVVDGMQYKGSPNNMMGLNFRMTEIEAAIGQIQLSRLEKLVTDRRSIIGRIEEGLSKIDFLEMPKVMPNTSHAYYVHVMKYDRSKAKNVPREKFVQAVNRELMPTGVNTTRNSMVSCGYVKPLYFQSLYQNALGSGKNGHPWNYFEKSQIPSYSAGLCPVTEKMHFEEVILSDLIHTNLSEEDVNDIILAFNKVAENLGELI